MDASVIAAALFPSQEITAAAALLRAGVAEILAPTILRQGERALGRLSN